MDLDMDDIAASVSVSEEIKQQDEAVLCDLMEVEGDDGNLAAEVLILHKNPAIGDKGKAKLGSDDTLQYLVKDGSSSDLVNSVAGSADSADDHLNSGSLKSDNNRNNNSSNSDLSYHDNEELCGDDYDGLEDDDCDYDENDEYLFEDDEDDYLTMQSKFDNVDLPAGVEVSLSWLNTSAPTKNGSGPSSSSGPDNSGSKVNDPDNSGSKMNASVLSPVEIDKKETAPSDIKSPVISPSSSAVPAESSSNNVVEENVENAIMQKLKNFKQFDTVEDFSDHHYKGTGFVEKQPPKNWAKRIQDEWKILEKNLPDTIFVRVYETRMELLRAVIGGPAGTPYHDGLFVFDCLFPEGYPNEPPSVYYYSGGLRLNPNLYECGKVCLSLLGTWSGKQDEMWIPGKSTMLQVLVSIQALILNAKPFYNEPGYDKYVGAEGERRSQKYSEEAFTLSLKTMMYTLRRPPKYFEDLVIGHFHNRARALLVACKAYVAGATVGTVTVKDGVAEVNGANSASSEFKEAVKRLINALVTNLKRFASIDCEEFRITN